MGSGASPRSGAISVTTPTRATMAGAYREVSTKRGELAPCDGTVGGRRKSDADSAENERAGCWFLGILRAHKSTMPTRTSFCLALLSTTAAIAASSGLPLGAVDYSEWTNPDTMQIAADGTGALYMLVSCTNSG